MENIHHLVNNHRSASSLREIAHHAQVGEPFATSDSVSATGAQYQTTAGGVIITHRAMILNPAPTSAGFTSWKMPLNPGLAAFAPWLSRMADQYTRYRFLKLEYTFVPRVAATTAGTVAFSSTTNPSTPAPGNLSDAMQYDFASDGSVREKLGWPSLRAKTGRAFRNAIGGTRLIRTKFYGNDILPLYDPGFVLFITEGVPTGQVLGDVWVDYSVELIEPRIQPLLPYAHNTAIFAFTPGIFNLGTERAIQPTAVVDPFGIRISAATGLAYGDPNLCALRLPAGLWKIEYDLCFFSTTANASTFDMFIYKADDYVLPEVANLIVDFQTTREGTGIAAAYRFVARATALVSASGNDSIWAAIVLTNAGQVDLVSGGLDPTPTVQEGATMSGIKISRA